MFLKITCYTDNYNISGHLTRRRQFLLPLKIAFSLVVAVVLVCGCGSAADPSREPDDTPREISFRIAGAGASRGEPELDFGRLQQRHFGVFMSLERDPYDNHPANYVTNADFHCLPDNKTFVGGIYWPLKDPAQPKDYIASFFAYAPYQSGRDALGSQVRFDSYLKEIAAGHPGPLKLDVIPETDNIYRQIDFCVAPPAYDLTRTSGPASMAFYHAMGRVKLKAAYVSSLEGGKMPGDVTHVRVDAVKFTDLRSHRVICYPQPGGGIDDFTWEDPTDENGDTVTPRNTFTLKRNAYSDNTSPLINAGEEQYLGTEPKAIINESAGVLYVLPQTLVEGMTLEVTYSLLKRTVSGATETVTVLSTRTHEYALPWQDADGNPQEWTRAGIYTYTFKVPVGFNGDLTVTMESEEGDTGPIKPYDNWHSGSDKEF